MVRKTLLSVVMTVFGSVLLITNPVSAATSLTSWEKGVLVQPQSSSDFSSANFQQSMRNLAADGANNVTLVVPLHQSNIYSSDVHVDANTPTDQSLTSAIQYIRSLGMQATLSIHDDSSDGQWRAFINPSDRSSWFNNYGQLLNHYGDIAAAAGGHEIVIGTEMTSLTLPSYSSANTPGWVSLIKNLRSHFSGVLTYSAQHGGYMSDLRGLEFWPYLDVIGVSAYYSMGSNTASVDDMKNTWSQIDKNELSQVASAYGKKVVFTEVGYVSGSNALSDPGSAFANPGSPNQTIQANAYEALLSYWSGSSYMQGVDFWDWSTNPSAGGSNDVSYVPQNKAAESTLKQWYTATGASSPTPSPATATYTAAASNASATTGASVTSTATVSASQPTSNVIVDLEVYNSAGQKVAQKFVEGQNLSSTGTQYSVTWTPSQAGQYTLKAGIFTANWQSNLYWNGNLAVITSSDPAQTTSPSPQPTSSTSPAPSPTPTSSPTPAPSTSTVDIWWPSNGSSITGVQPFKALINGVDQNSYNMYWRVDSGQLNLMSTVTDGGAHKEALVDVSGWNWHGPGGKYVITFIAKDANGAVIAQSSTTVTTGQ